jgi:RNA polymerase sigma factor (sigma-70 family)
VAKEKSDKQLIIEYKNGTNEYSLGVLIKRYSKYAKSLAKKYLLQNSNSGITYDEMYAVGVSATYIAIVKYNTDSDNEFYPYWYTVASNEIIRYIQENSYMYKGKTFAGDISLDDKKESRLFADVYGQNDREMEKSRAHNDLVEYLNDPHIKLTKDERKIMQLLIEGYEIKEISIKLNIATSVIYDRYHRVLKKIRKRHNK